jgi:hypothetical protein
MKIWGHFEVHLWQNLKFRHEGGTPFQTPQGVEKGGRAKKHKVDFQQK